MVILKEGNWIAYLLIGLIAYTAVMLYISEAEPAHANQINSSVIIGLLIAILLKINKK